jgi:Uma2 family endonuclease
MSALITLPPVTRKPAESASGTPLFQISVKQYHEMIDQGILTTNDRVELLNGLLVRKMAQAAPHARTIRRLTRFLPTVLPLGWIEQFQLPIMVDTSEPEPDAAILRGTESTFRDRHPTPSDFGIVIEVADTTLRYDRTEKGPVYAAAAIPEYWIINLEEQVVEVYTQPTPDGYGLMQLYRAGESVPFRLDGNLITSFSVTDLFATSDE